MRQSQNLLGNTASGLNSGCATPDSGSASCTQPRKIGSTYDRERLNEKCDTIPPLFCLIAINRDVRQTAPNYSRLAGGKSRLPESSRYPSCLDASSVCFGPAIYFAFAAPLPRAAQRAFIISESFFRPAAERPPPLFLPLEAVVTCGALSTVAPLLLAHRALAAAESLARCAADIVRPF